MKNTRLLWSAVLRTATLPRPLPCYCPLTRCELPLQTEEVWSADFLLKNQQQKHLGLYRCEEDAARAWDAVARKVYDEETLPKQVGNTHLRSSVDPTLPYPLSCYGPLTGGDAAQAAGARRLQFSGV